MKRGCEAEQAGLVTAFSDVSKGKLGPGWVFRRVAGPQEYQNSSKNSNKTRGKVIDGTG